MTDTTLAALPRDSQGFVAVHNPYTGEVIGSVCATTAESVDEIMARARRGRATA
ncbi:MAG: aldehyde dehydrogenase, partial [Streptomyces sp.]|nr:aldehyde dehydrogenase [Streptomyces sp.]